MRNVLLFLAVVAAAFSQQSNSPHFENRLKTLEKVGEEYVMGIENAARSKWDEGRYYLKFYPQRRAENVMRPGISYNLHTDPVNGNPFVSIVIEPPSVKMMAMRESKIPIVVFLHPEPNGVRLTEALTNWAEQIANQGFYVFIPDLIGMEKLQFDTLNMYYQKPNWTAAQEIAKPLMSDRIGELRHRIKLGFYKLSESVSVFAPKQPDFNKVAAVGLGDLGGMAVLDMARTELLGVKGVMSLIGDGFSPLDSQPYTSHTKVSALVVSSRLTNKDPKLEAERAKFIENLYRE